MESMKTLKARVDKGHWVSIEPANLPDGTETTLVFADEGTPEEVPTETVWQFAARLAASVENVDDLPTDVSENVDHYLYGAPRKSS